MRASGERDLAGASAASPPSITFLPFATSFSPFVVAE